MIVRQGDDECGQLKMEEYPFCLFEQHSLIFISLSDQKIFLHYILVGAVLFFLTQQTAMAKAQ